MEQLKPGYYFDLPETQFGEWLASADVVLDLIPRIGDLIHAAFIPGVLGEVCPSAHIGERVFIGEDTKVLPGTVILGPAIIGSGCTIGPNAYIRQNVILCDGAHVGHVCEVKNALLMEGALVPHFAYVGDSLLGRKAHLGAGVKLSNVRIDGKDVQVKMSKERFETGLRKFGAILGDGAEVGCNAVLNPGTLVGPRTLIAGAMLAGGFYPCDSFVSHGHSCDVRPRK